MKTLILKKLTNFDYKLNILALLQNAPAEGYKIEEVRLAVKAIDALKEAKEKVDFEDDVAGFVKDAVSKAKYRVATPELVKFLDDIDTL